MDGQIPDSDNPSDLDIPTGPALNNGTTIRKAVHFKNRNTGLAVFGAVQLIMGCCSLLMVVLLVVLANEPSFGMLADSKTMVPLIGMYVLAGVMLSYLGIGSILAKRWARALTLVLAWMGLVSGVWAIFVMAFWTPELSNQGVTQDAGLFYLLFLIVTGGVLVIVPGLFVLFYRSPHVRDTCQYRNPELSWTDHCPLPVLGLSLLLAFGSVSMLMTSLGVGVIPVFGVFFRGTAGLVVIIGIGLLFAYLALATYKLKKSAWWATLIVYFLFGVSSVVTYSRFTMIEFYQEMGYPEEQLQLLKESEMAVIEYSPLITGLSFLMMLAYIVFVRKHFVADSTGKTA